MEGLERFVKAQELIYSSALLEVQSGKKTGHWIWYIFPQMKGLGKSSRSVYYGIKDIEEAKNYFNHPILGARLREITQELLDLPSYLTAEKIFGVLDALKVQSSMTLFYCVSKDNLFLAIINKFYKGKFDTKTWYHFERNFAFLRELYKKYGEECNNIIGSLGYYEATRTVEARTLPYSFETHDGWYLLDGFGFDENGDFIAWVADLQTGPPVIGQMDAIAIPDNIITKVLLLLNENLSTLNK